MDTPIDQQIQQRLAELPEDVRNTVLSADVGKRIQEIGADNKLHIDQINILENETLMVMLGFTDPSDFADTLIKQLSIPNEAAEKIAGDMAEKLFVPIRESMKKYYDERASKLTPTEIAAAPAAVAGAPTPEESDTSSPEIISLGKTLQEISDADIMLTGKTVVLPGKEKVEQTAPLAPKTGTYKMDPYREPSV